MKKIYLIILIIILSISYSLTRDLSSTPPVSEHQKLFVDMKLENIINYDVFEKAIIGYSKLDMKRKDVITLIDFSKPSTEERLYVLDLKNKKLLHSSHVSHGKNSGANYATTFSNRKGSNMSSLGFYITENTYQGKNGYSLIINGLEKGINDKAKERAVVIHGADYANPSVIPSSGRLGRSQGCPALPRALTENIISTIKGGTLLFIYAEDKDYLSQSPILSTKNNVALM